MYTYAGNQNIVIKIYPAKGGDRLIHVTNKAGSTVYSTPIIYKKYKQRVPILLYLAKLFLSYKTLQVAVGSYMVYM